MMRDVYADHAATTRIAPEALEAMRPFLEDRFGNPSSVHRRGEAARAAVDAARVQVAQLIGAAPEEIVFTSSGSEANNLALKGVLAGAPAGRRRLVVSAIEHPSVLETARHLESHGCALTVVPVEPDGIVDPQRLAAALGPDVALVSVMWVNNEVGTIQPVRAIADAAHAAGARFHCDAVQAAGRLAVDVEAAGADLLSLAAHKLGGPPGAAALAVRRRLRLTPLVHGGHQERSRRAGTENLPALAGFGAAAARAGARLAAGEPRRLGALAEGLRERLLAACRDTRLNGDPARRVPAIFNLTGSACSAASPGPSHVLTAMGLRPEDAHASVRFSFGDGNDEADMDHVFDTTPAVVERLRALHRPAVETRS
ncbi:MAG: cysteine desulfurase [Candidatus Eisenbacteria bacterium]|nr:cysteine desulfurase [Candidatus Eisenbacteria bacterium]